MSTSKSPAVSVIIIFLNEERFLAEAAESVLAQTLADWELHLSSIFTEVRSYAYIEVRSADLQPDDLILSVPALWTGLFYDDDALAAALELGRGHDSHAAWRAAMDSAARLGMDGTAGDHALRDLAAEMLGIAAGTLRGRAHAAGASGVRALERLGERHALPLGRVVP